MLRVAFVGLRSWRQGEILRPEYISAYDWLKTLSDSTRRRIVSNPPTTSEIKFMTRLGDEGLSFDATLEQLYNKYGYTLDGRSIRRLTQTASHGNDASQH